VELVTSHESSTRFDWYELSYMPGRRAGYAGIGKRLVSPKERDGPCLPRVGDVLSNADNFKDGDVAMWQTRNIQDLVPVKGVEVRVLSSAVKKGLRRWTRAFSVGNAS